MLFMKVEMFGTQKNAMPLSFSNFDFLPIYKGDSGAYPFMDIHVLKFIDLPCRNDCCVAST